MLTVACWAATMGPSTRHAARDSSLNPHRHPVRDTHLSVRDGRDIKPLSSCV